MVKSKSRILVTFLLVLIMLVSILQIKSLATNTDIYVLKENDNEYLIYIDGLLNENFEFAFSNTEDATELRYFSSTKDSEENSIAYVNEELLNNFFNSENTYMWVRTEDKVIINGEKIILNDAKTMDQLKTIENLTKNITIKADAEDDKITINGEEGKTYSYQLFVPGSSEEYNKLLKLVEKINKYDETTSAFTKLNDYDELYELYNLLTANLGDNWSEAKNLEISKPYGAKEGSQYVLWLKDSDGNIDFQILTAYEEEITITEEREKTEEVVTTLPVTYDDMTPLFIALGAVIVGIIAIVVFKNVNKRNKV